MLASITFLNVNISAVTTFTENQPFCIAIETAARLTHASDRDNLSTLTRRAVGKRERTASPTADTYPQQESHPFHPDVSLFSLLRLCLRQERLYPFVEEACNLTSLLDSLPDRTVQLRLAGRDPLAQDGDSLVWKIRARGTESTTF
jgi:hypothetical protein